MQSVNSPRLEIIGASIIDESVFVPVMSLFWAISSLQNGERIQELEIKASIESKPEDTFTAQRLEPLFALPRLTTLRLHLRCRFDLDDSMLEHAARTWPNIRVLELGLLSSQSDTRVTLAALVPFAQHCSDLQTLGFTLDAASLPRASPDLHEPRAGAACVMRELKVLKVGCARIVDPQDVAAFLIDLFPRLVEVQHDDVREWGDSWDEVCYEYIPALARERELGGDREWTPDDIDAHVWKLYHIGRRRPG